MSSNKNFSRRQFIGTTGAVAAGALFVNPVTAMISGAKTKQKLALVGTGSRGTSFWGKAIIERYPNEIEFVGLCDINPGRVEYAKKYMGVGCPVFTNFEEMISKTKPDTVIVTTVDATHHLFIVKALEMGCNVITEKPLTTDEVKCQAILDAERKAGKKVIVGFNYRWGVQFTELKKLLAAKRVGKITSVDFHWYLNTSHGADYFRRWHRLVEKSGSLWVHKASHHFDLLNWWIDSDPERVYALGELEFYGKNGPFRAPNCRNCPHTGECKFYYDITKDERLKKLYPDNEKYDGYFRDGCVFRNDVNIYDKMAATIKYKNGVQVAYSLTAYSPYEGYRIAFNGTEGRMDAWIQESNPTTDVNYDEIVVYKNFGKRQYIQIPKGAGHGGGDKLLKDQIFIPETADPLKQAAGIRDGALACLVGIAARKSIVSVKPQLIEELTTIEPQVDKIYKRV